MHGCIFPDRSGDLVFRVTFFVLIGRYPSMLFPVISCPYLYRGLDIFIGAWIFLASCNSSRQGCLSTAICIALTLTRCPENDYI